MKIQNIVQTITANSEEFDLKSERKGSKRDNAPFLIDEYFITHTVIDDYTTRISVLDEDQNLIVTAVVDIFDDVVEAERQLAFVASISDRFRRTITDAQLRAILDGYELFAANAQFPTSHNHNFDDLNLVKNLFSFLHRGGTTEEFFTPPAATRKNRATDYSQNRFRTVATQIASTFPRAS